jgi:YYY domain-containing protein
MATFILWYIAITILGWLTFPLAYHLLPALKDRGYTLTRALGLLIWGYVFWLFASLGIAQNDAGGLLLALIVLVGLSLWKFNSLKAQIVDFLKSNRSFVITTELLFLIAFAAMAFIRANNPEIFTAGGEKWMEVAFINAILHSPAFPPHDPWLSGYAISYYYFGYVMAAMLAKLTSTPAPIAHNLMLALIFGLSFNGAYGLLYNLLGARKRSGGDVSQESEAGSPRDHVRDAIAALLGPLFLLIVSNLEGFLESIHRKGIGWTFDANGNATSSFWSWINLQTLTDPPQQPLQWVPDQFFWWWRASRVLQDYDLNGARLEVIDEFPFFSYLLGDVHPHVLAMPFNLLAIAVALNLFLGGWQGQIDLFFGQLKINKTGFIMIALVLGGLAFLNTWDILPAAALIVFSYALARVRESGWGWERLEDILLLGIPAAVTSFVMYLPFFIGFDSQAGGIVPNFMFVTRGAHLWVMWGTLFIPLFAYLIYLWRSQRTANWRVGLLSTFGFMLLLVATMFVVGFLAVRLQPDLVNQILAGQGRTLGNFIFDSMVRRWTNIGSLLTLLALLIPTIAFLTRRDEVSDDSASLQQPSTLREPQGSAFQFRAPTFVLLLMSLGVLIILGPEFFFLRDDFGYRINTMFKFYYQAWILLSIAAAFGVAVMLYETRRVAAWLSTTVIVIAIGLGLVYPAFSIPSKTDNFKSNNPEQRTLDGSLYLSSIMPDDYQAFQFMHGLDQGVVAEAVGGQYSEFARVSTFTGMPTVLGWPGHEGQWRDDALQGSRQDDIATLYATDDWNIAREIVDRYDIRYVYVGNLERTTYPVNEEKFNLFSKPIYQMGNVTIYEVP